MIELIYGGSGSGKSAYAEKRVMELNNTWKYYVATMRVYGEEGKQKVENHRRLRAGKGFITVEKSSDLGELVRNEIDVSENVDNLKLQVSDSCVLLECMSNLLANEMFCENGIINGEEEVVRKVMDDIRRLSESVENLVIVSNNIFEDGIEYDEDTKSYLWALGKVNCRISEIADRVTEVVVGIPVLVKE